MQVIQNEEDLQILSLPLQSSIKKIISDERYTICDVKVNSFQAKAGNFFSEIYEVNVKGETKDARKETSVIIKKKVTLNKMVCFPVAGYYLREGFFYGDALKQFNVLQDAANVPLTERYRAASVYDVRSDAIILENLSRRHFKTYSRTDIIPIKFFELAIKELAKFHAISFVIEKNMPNYFNDKIKTLEYLVSCDDEVYKYGKNICDYISNLFEDNVVKKKITKWSIIMVDKFRNYNNDKTYRCTLSHGDFKTNNILVRYVDDTPVEVVPIDYQLINYGCPIRDFFYLVFVGSDREFRRKNFNNLKDLYYEELSSFLQYFDMDVETEYPRKEFERINKDWLEYGLLIWLLTVIFVFPLDSNIKVEDLKVSEIPLKFDERVQRMMRELIEDFIQLGFLD